MNRKLKIVAAVAALLLATGCATKKGFEVPGFAFGCPIGDTKVGSMEDLVQAPRRWSRAAAARCRRPRCAARNRAT